jgi:hypothetical protein
MEHSAIALPDQGYLARIGEVAYIMSSMEWTILGDLQTFAGDLPATLSLAQLEPHTASGIARIIKDAAAEMAEMADGSVKDYFVGELQSALRCRQGQKRCASCPSSHTPERQSASSACRNDEPTNHRNLFLDRRGLVCRCNSQFEQLDH